MTKRRLTMKIKTITIEKTVDNLTATFIIKEPLEVFAESSVVAENRNPLDASLETMIITRSLNFFNLFADGVVVTVELFDGSKVVFYSDGSRVAK